MCGPQAASRIAAKNSAHLFMHSLLSATELLSAPGRRPGGRVGQGAGIHEVLARPRVAGAYDTRRAPSVSIPVNTRTNQSLCFSLAFPGCRSLESDAWDDPSLVLLCRGLRPHFVAGCMGQIGAAERSAGRTASNYTTLFYTALIKHNFSRSWHRCGACCEGTSAALRVGAQ